LASQRIATLDPVTFFLCSGGLTITGADNRRTRQSEITGRTRNQSTRASAGFWLWEVNAPLPPEAKKILKI